MAGSVVQGHICVPVWLSGRALRQQCKRLWVRFPENTRTNENVYPECNCKSLWIKASAKCINVNVNFMSQYLFCSLVCVLVFPSGNADPVILIVCVLQGHETSVLLILEKVTDRNLINCTNAVLQT